MSGTVFVKTSKSLAPPLATLSMATAADRAHSWDGRPGGRSARAAAASPASGGGRGAAGAGAADHAGGAARQRAHCRQAVAQGSADIGGDHRAQCGRSLAASLPAARRSIPHTVWSSHTSVMCASAVGNQQEQAQWIGKMQWATPTPPPGSRIPPAARTPARPAAAVSTHEPWCALELHSPHATRCCAQLWPTTLLRGLKPNGGAAMQASHLQAGSTGGLRSHPTMLDAGAH